MRSIHQLGYICKPKTDFKMIKKLFISLLTVAISLSSISQNHPIAYELGAIQNNINHLGTLGRVLYVAAHPDDENTRLITYFAKEKGYQTGYFSFTRGDGGQNLIGTEIWEELGLIRTQELLEARKIDGGYQFFSRAFDFGYSKTEAETFEKWNKQEMLEDLVLVIRAFKPDVIITRFSPTLGKTHGHHTASAILALEAFKMAGDANIFPEQLKNENISTWQAKSIYWNTSTWFFRDNADFDKSQLLTIDIGNYNPFLGKSMGEIAADSRSKHSSQGFGSAQTRGEIEEFFQHLDGEKVKKDFFENIVTDFSRIKTKTDFKTQIATIQKEFNANSPNLSIKKLLLLNEDLKKAILENKVSEEKQWLLKKKEETERLILACSGIFIDANAADYAYTLNDSIAITFNAIDRMGVKAKVESLKLGQNVYKTDISLIKNLPGSFKFKHKPDEISQALWLKKARKADLFDLDNKGLIYSQKWTGANDFNLQAKLVFEIDNQKFEINPSFEITYKWVEPSSGEKTRPVEIRPNATLSFNSRVVVFGSDNFKEIDFKIKANEANANGVLSFEVPAGWKILPQEIPFSIKNKYEEQNFRIRVMPPTAYETAVLKAQIKINNQTFSQQMREIKYNHIPYQTWFPEAELKLVKVQTGRTFSKIGYIPGAGDEVAAGLMQLGYEVTQLTDDDITVLNLKKYEAVVVGIRAFNTNKNLAFLQSALNEYVNQGGNVIVQYNTTGDLQVKQIGPYSMKISRDRVTEEDCKVSFINPKHPILNFPNKITEKDFDGWIQERGLYFPNEWSSAYEPILEMNDKNEKPLKGALLVAKLGKGSFIYTGLSFFREIPDGVPGAYRLLVNLIEHSRTIQGNLKEEDASPRLNKKAPVQRILLNE